MQDGRSAFPDLKALNYYMEPIMATKQTEKVASEVALAQTTALATAALDFASDAGAGMEGTSAESFAIPFLGILQKGSPQVDEASGASIEGAKAGMLYENVTGKMFDGKAGVIIVPCAYRRVFLRWAPKANDGGGFKGELAPEVVAEMRSKGGISELDGRLYIPLEDGTVNEKKCDSIKDTRNHYILIIDPETGAWKEALLSLTSTQVKKSKMLMSALASVKVNGPNGMFTPPTFANFVRLSTVPESNDKGTWFGAKFELAGNVDRAEVYSAAKAFHASVSKGAVIAKYEDDASASSESSGGF